MNMHARKVVNISCTDTHVEALVLFSTVSTFDLTLYRKGFSSGYSVSPLSQQT